jgi:hypothetical protein
LAWISSSISAHFIYKFPSLLFNIDGVSGISAAFLVWDAIDLGFTISDLVRRQGSKAGKILR